MTYPEASRILMSPMPPAAEAGKENNNTVEPQRPLDAELRERVRWLGTAMLDFFEHVWTQAQNGGLPRDIWEAWEDYMGKMLSETRLRHVWQAERGYYAPGFRRFVDLKVGVSPEVPAMPPLPRPSTGALASRPADASTPQVARVMRAVTAEKDQEKENNTTSRLE